MSASMAEGVAAVLAEHQYTFSTQIETDLKRRCRKDTKWCTCGFEVTVYVDELDRNECYDTSDRLRAKLAAHQAEQLAANGYGKLPATVTEWASAFRATGARYNYHRTQAEAEDFVKSMNEVDADMVVITRQHTPATNTEWILA